MEYAGEMMGWNANRFSLGPRWRMIGQRCLFLDGSQVQACFLMRQLSSSILGSAGVLDNVEFIVPNKSSVSLHPARKHLEACTLIVLIAKRQMFTAVLLLPSRATSAFDLEWPLPACHVYIYIHIFREQYIAVSTVRMFIELG